MKILWGWRAGASTMVAAALATALIARTAAAPLGQVDADVVAVLTAPQSGARLHGRSEVRGFAADQRSADGSGLNERDIQLWLDDVADERYLLDYAGPGVESPEAAARLGPRFANVGFRGSWETCSFPPGAHTLTLWVSSLAVPGARNTTSVDVQVEPCAPGTALLRRDFGDQPGGVDTIRVPGRAGVSRRLLPIFAEFAVGIEARCARPDQGCGYGIDFRRRPGPGLAATDSMYSFDVDPQGGRFRLLYVPISEPGEAGVRGEPIVPYTMSSAIRRGTESNRLAVVAQGDWLRLFVNGEQVADARDARLLWGRVGWRAVNLGGGGAEVHFDRVVVTTPGPPEAVIPQVGR